MIDSDTALGQPAENCLIGSFRRRGAALESAILSAAIEEFSSVGYAGFSIESVAARAQTGKAAIYRRWSNKQELLVAALTCEVPALDAVLGSTAFKEAHSTRDALVFALTSMAAALQHQPGRIVRALVAEMGTDAALRDVVRQHLVLPGRARFEGLMRRGVERGEVRAAAIGPLIIDIGPSLVLRETFFEGRALPADTIEKLVDEVLMPLLGAGGR